MMTPEEAQELTKLIIRAPLSQIEAWWVRDLIARNTQPPAAQTRASQKGKRADTKTEVA